MTTYEVFRRRFEDGLIVEVGTVEASSPKSAKRKSEGIMAKGSEMFVIPKSNIHEFISDG